MLIQYVTFYISVGLLMAVLLNLINIFTFRIKGKVVGYQFKIGSAEYDKYRSHAGTKALLVTLLGIVILSILIAFQAWAVAREHVSESTRTLVFGSALTVAASLWIIYKLAAAIEKNNTGYKPKNSVGKHHKDDSWLV